MVASSFGHVEVLTVLIFDGGADPNALHNFAGSTALHFAAEMGRSLVIGVLCDAGANVNSRTIAGGTPLHTAADSNQSRAAAVLLSSRCRSDPNALLAGDSTPLYLAAQRGLNDMIRVLVNYGSGLNFAMPAPQASLNAGSALLDPRKVHSFYSAKNTVIGNGATALHAAVENGHLATTRVLLELGASQLTSMQGASPVLIAIQYNHPDIALLLLEEPGEPLVNARTPHDGLCALAAAAMAGFDSVVQRLLVRGASPWLKTNFGHTALDLAHSQRIRFMLTEAEATTAKPSDKMEY